MKTLIGIGLIMWGVVMYFGNYAFTALTRDQNHILLWALIGAGIILILYTNLCMKKENKKLKDNAAYYYEKLHESTEEANDLFLKVSELKRQNDKLEKQAIGWKGNFVQIRNRYERKKEETERLLKMYCDINIKYSVLQSKMEYILQLILL